MLITPIYSVFINPSICSLSPSTCVNGVKIAGGEAPLVFFASLVVIPLLVWKGGRGMNLAVFGLTAALAFFDLLGLGADGFVYGFSFGRSPVCYLFAGNCLDHNFFHLSQIPFYAAIAFLSYRENRMLRPEQAR